MRRNTPPGAGGRASRGSPPRSRSGLVVPLRRRHVRPESLDPVSGSTSFLLQAGSSYPTDPARSSSHTAIAAVERRRDEVREVRKRVRFLVRSCTAGSREGRCEVCRASSPRFAWARASWRGCLLDVLVLGPGNPLMSADIAGGRCSGQRGARDGSWSPWRACVRLMILALGTW